MAIWGLSGASVASGLLYAGAINGSAQRANFPPPLLYAICFIESIGGEYNDEWNAATVISADGGHGLGQLTASYPDNWSDPSANADYAVSVFLVPAVNYWHGNMQLTGEALIKCVAATYNAGLGNAQLGFTDGNVDEYTTGHDYGRRCIAVYNALVAGGPTCTGRELLAALGAA
jgi:hypothetical protein